MSIGNSYQASSSSFFDKTQEELNDLMSTLDTNYKNHQRSLQESNIRSAVSNFLDSVTYGGLASGGISATYAAFNHSFAPLIVTAGSLIASISGFAAKKLFIDKKTGFDTAFKTWGLITYGLRFQNGNLIHEGVRKVFREFKNNPEFSRTIEGLPTKEGLKEEDTFAKIMHKITAIGCITKAAEIMENKDEKDIDVNNFEYQLKRALRHFERSGVSKSDPHFVRTKYIYGELVNALKNEKENITKLESAVPKENAVPVPSEAV